MHMHVCVHGQTKHREIKKARIKLRKIGEGIPGQHKKIHNQSNRT